jgi:hypothetical protein
LQLWPSYGAGSWSRGVRCGGYWSRRLRGRIEELREAFSHVSALTRVKGHQRAPGLHFRCESVKEGNPTCGGAIRALEGHLEAKGLGGCGPIWGTLDDGDGEVGGPGGREASVRVGMGWRGDGGGKVTSHGILSLLLSYHTWSEHTQKENLRLGGRTRGSWEADLGRPTIQGNPHTGTLVFRQLTSQRPDRLALNKAPEPTPEILSVVSSARCAPPWFIPIELPRCTHLRQGLHPPRQP